MLLQGLDIQGKAECLVVMRSPFVQETTGANISGLLRLSTSLRSLLLLAFPRKYAHRRGQGNPSQSTSPLYTCFLEKVGM